MILSLNMMEVNLIEVNGAFLTQFSDKELIDWFMDNSPFVVHLFPSDFKDNSGDLGKLKSGYQKIIQYAYRVIYHDGFGVKKIVKDRGIDSTFNNDYINT